MLNESMSVGGVVYGCWAMVVLGMVVWGMVMWDVVWGYGRILYCSVSIVVWYVSVRYGGVGVRWCVVVYGEVWWFRVY